MINKCPKCGGEIQATVPLYLSDVVLDDDGYIESYRMAFKEDSVDAAVTAIADCDPNEVKFYCENDHNIEI